MDNDRAVIQEHPIPSLITFDAYFSHLKVMQPFFDAVRDTLNLAVALPAANYKVVGDNKNLANIDNDYVARLFIRSDRRG
ncbi:MAG TPA: hypothetical protein VGK02_05040 [Candidatus Aquicultor sp.]